MPTTPTYSTPEQVAERFGVTVGTVYDWLKSGKLKGSRVGGRGRWRITLATLEECDEPVVVANAVDEPAPVRRRPSREAALLADRRAASREVREECGLKT